MNQGNHNIEETSGFNQKNGKNKFKSVKMHLIWDKFQRLEMHLFWDGGSIIFVSLNFLSVV